MAQQVGLSSRVKLSNGLSMPRIHLGVYMMSGSEAKNAVKHALDAGYRGIDSAEMYRNERETGHAILDWLSSSANTHALTRADIHFTTKLASTEGYDHARKSIRRSIKASGLDYLDLYLVHSPYGGKRARLESWRAIEDAILDGEIQSGGVSNFGVKHIQELVASKPRIMPTVNQIEVHPFNTRQDIRDICAKHDILVEAYAPLVRALRMKHPSIAKLSKKYNVDPGQLLVRWSVQHGMVPLPKSVSRERIQRNGNVGGFEISSDDMSELDALDEYLVTDWDPVNCP